MVLAAVGVLIAVAVVPVLVHSFSMSPSYSLRFRAYRLRRVLMLISLLPLIRRLLMIRNSVVNFMLSLSLCLKKQLITV
jgi:hypothetical protein